MATGGLYGQSSAGIVSPQSGSESTGLYGNNTVFGGTYFEWFVFQESATQPATPTGGSWSFATNSGTPPTGWVLQPPVTPVNQVWVSIALVNSKTTATLTWSTPGLFGVVPNFTFPTPITGPAGSSAAVVNTGTATNPILTFTIPRGDKGDTGTAATIAVGTTTTTNPGTSATVTNSGTSGAAVFNFGIPRGAGVNSGGTAGQVLTKASSTDYDTTWTTITGTLNYRGTWNASTNTPTLSSGTGTNGYYYVVSVAGTTNLDGITDWQIGDWAIFNGNTWQKLDQTNLVTSVNGQTGAVTVGTVTFVGTGTGLSGGPITSSGTINFSNSAVGTWAATPSSANLAAAVSDETGSGALVFGTTPTLSAPTVGGTNPYVQFNNGSAVALAAGRLWYDGTTGSWNAGMGGGNITQQIGEELFIYGKASAAITDSPLQIVYQTGTVGASGVVTFGPTVAGITNGDLIIGAATESIALNGFGRITSFGVIHGVTTNGTAYGETWSDGDIIWYNPVTGNPTNVKPIAPNIKVQIGILIKAGSGGSGSIQIEINHGSVLGGTDSNVQLTSPANNQILSYDSTAGYWKNVSSLNGVPVGNTTASSGAFTTLTASSDPTFTSTGAVQLPSGTTAQQPTGVAGKLRFNTTTSQFEGYNGTIWASVGGAAISNDTATASYEYPLFASATTGTALTVYTSNAKYLYKPSTGELQASLVTATNGIHMNSQSISTSVTIPVGYSANSTGPITIASGQSVTVSSGSRWVVL